MIKPIIGDYYLYNNHRFRIIDIKPFYLNVLFEPFEDKIENIVAKLLFNYWVDEGKLRIDKKYMRNKKLSIILKSEINN